MEIRLGVFQLKSFRLAIEEGSKAANLAVAKQRVVAHHCWDAYSKHLVKTLSRAIERARTTDETVKEIIEGL